MRQELSGLIDHRNLASGAQSRIDAQYRDRARRCSQQQVVQVVAEHLDRVRIRALLQLQPQLALDRRIQQPLPAVVNRGLEMRRPIALRTQDLRPQQRGRAQRLQLDQEVQHRLGLAAPHRQHAVRRNRLHRLAILVVHLELLLLVDRVQRLLADDDAFVVHHRTQRLAQVGVLADRLRNDVPSAFERVLDRRHLLLRVHEGHGKLRQRLRGRLLRPQIVGKRPQTAIARNRRLRSPLRTIGQVEVFQLRAVKGRLDARLQLVGQLALLLD
jgi:hypothetical protein